MHIIWPLFWDVLISLARNAENRCEYSRKDDDATTWTDQNGAHHLNKTFLWLKSMTVNHLSKVSESEWAFLIFLYFSFYYYCLTVWSEVSVRECYCQPSVHLHLSVFLPALIMKSLLLLKLIYFFFLFSHQERSVLSIFLMKYSVTISFFFILIVSCSV